MPEQIVQVNDDIFVRVIDIDLERRRISLSLKQANESSDGQAVEEFDPYLYGMAPAFDEAGNYTGPAGFDPETGEWKVGFEEQRTDWEREYAEAHSRWEAHRKQMSEAKEADQAAAVESGDASAYSSESTASEGTLADDSALQALRDKLTTE
jgi:small subunit ribosomal protein S1